MAFRYFKGSYRNICYLFPEYIFLSLMGTYPFLEEVGLYPLLVEASRLINGK